MDRFQQTKALVAHARELLPQITAEYESSLERQQVAPKLLIDVKNLMENLRSALDYGAHEIFSRYGNSPKASPNIYFPYSRIGQSAGEYRTRVDTCIPGLSASRPDIVALLETYQPFSGTNNEWLPQFMDLNNENKHQELTPQICVEKRAMKVSVGNQTFVGFGITIRGGKWIINGQEMPQGAYTPDNLPPVPSPATAEVVTWNSFHFSSNNLEVLPFLRDAVDRVDAIVTNLAAV